MDISGGYNACSVVLPQVESFGVVGVVAMWERPLSVVPDPMQTRGVAFDEWARFSALEC